MALWPLWPLCASTRAGFLAAEERPWPPDDVDGAGAVRRLARAGPNLLARPERPPYFELAWRQLRDPLVVLLVAAAAVSAAIGETLEAAAIAAIVDSVLAANAAKVDEYRGGKTALFGFFVGQVIKGSQGKANPQVVQRLVRDRLG